MTGSLSNASEAEPLRIRKASPEDAGSLTQIAHDAKRHWGYPEHWIKHWQDDLTISPDFIVANQVFVAEQDDQILGFYALKIRHEPSWITCGWLRNILDPVSGNSCSSTQCKAR